MKSAPFSPSGGILAVSETVEESGRQGKSEAIQRAQWVGMIQLFGYPSEHPCHTL